MPQVLNRPLNHDDDPSATTLRFHAPNGASVVVTVHPSAVAGEYGRALDVAREAIAGLAAAQAPRSGSRGDAAPAACGAAYWAWAMPEGWRQQGR